MCILDVNECDNGTHDCNVELGSCENTIGSFTCHCKPGFTGDGKNCSGSVIFLATTYCSHSTLREPPLQQKDNFKSQEITVTVKSI